METQINKRWYVFQIPKKIKKKAIHNSMSPIERLNLIIEKINTCEHEKLLFIKINIKWKNARKKSLKQFYSFV